MTDLNTDNYYSIKQNKIIIAQKPTIPRDHAKLLVYDKKSGSIIDDYFYNLENYLKPNTTLVMNNSKVEKCRFIFGKIEIFILEDIDETTYQYRCMVRPGRKFKLNNKINLTDDLYAKVIDIDGDGFRLLEFNISVYDNRLEEFRRTPYPPYIQADESLSPEYQTVFAKYQGSKAAPTAGLHFTDNLINQITRKHNIEYITLHVGLGTFAPLTNKNLEEGRLHEENYFVEKNTLERIINSDSRTVVGTTTLRTLESIARDYDINNIATDVEGSTDIFIRNPYDFRLVDSLITNFHLPSTSLMMLVEAFLGSKSELERIYNHAIDNGYRFYSFGDAMLIN